MGSLTFDLDFSTVDKNKQFKYKDIEVPIDKPLPNFDIEVLLDRSAVYNSLRNIFTWHRGERILNQEFGNPITPYIYEPINDVTANNIGQSIRQAIKNWEPRVNITKMTIIPNADQNEYNIMIVYSIPSLDADGLNFSHDFKINFV